MTNNDATSNGGGIYVIDEGNIILSEPNSVQIYLNSARKGGGISFNSLEESFSNLHYTNFPSSNFATAGQDLWAFDKGVKPYEIVCPKYKYFKFRLGVPKELQNSTNLYEISCPPCESGKTADENSVSCNFCEYGKAGINGKCNPCPINYYSDVSGAYYCKNCPPGKYTENNNSLFCIDSPKPCEYINSIYIYY